MTQVQLCLYRASIHDITSLVLYLSLSQTLRASGCLLLCSLSLSAISSLRLVIPSLELFPSYGPARPWLFYLACIGSLVLCAAMLVAGTSSTRGSHCVLRRRRRARREKLVAVHSVCSKCEQNFRCVKHWDLPARPLLALWSRLHVQIVTTFANLQSTHVLCTLA